MKKLYSIITMVLLLGVTAHQALAQPGVGAMYIGDYSKMSSKESIDREMENGNWAYRLSNLKNNKYTFTVTMADNSTREVRSKIYADSLANKSYVLAGDDNQRRIYCDKTKRISRSTGDATLTGFATDSCWLFKALNGRLNAYSFLSETAGLNSFYVVAIQVGDGPIRRFDPQQLQAIISNNPKAMKAFLKRDYYKAIEKYNTDN